MSEIVLLPCPFCGESYWQKHDAVTDCRILHHRKNCWVGGITVIHLALTYDVDRWNKRGKESEINTEKCPSCGVLRDINKEGVVEPCGNCGAEDYPAEGHYGQEGEEGLDAEAVHEAFMADRPVKK